MLKMRAGMTTLAFLYHPDVANLEGKRGQNVDPPCPHPHLQIHHCSLPLIRPLVCRVSEKALSGRIAIPFTADLKAASTDKLSPLLRFFP
jgi:hypothetical protein